MMGRAHCDFVDLVRPSRLMLLGKFCVVSTETLTSCNTINRISPIPVSLHMTLRSLLWRCEVGDDEVG